MKIYPLSFLFITTALLFSGCALDSDSTEGSLHPLGVWWWSPSIQDSRYLNFAVQNHVDEIYLSRPNSNQSIKELGPEVEEFVEKAGKQGIKVYLLLGLGYITYDDARLQDALRLYTDYQARVSENRRFAGIHLDIEFHSTIPNWRDRETEILAEYLALIDRLRSEIDGTMDIDIPSWYDQIILYKGEKRPLYQILIDLVDRVFVMSYRDTAAAMYRIAQEELNYAVSVNKPIMLGANMTSTEGDNFSYMEEGRLYLNEQLKLLKDLVKYPKAGVAIHHMTTWYELQD